MIITAHVRHDIPPPHAHAPAAQTIRAKLRAKKAPAVLSGEGEGWTPGPQSFGGRENPDWEMLRMRLSWGRVPPEGSRASSNPGAPVSNNNWRDPKATPNIPPWGPSPCAVGQGPQQWKPVSEGCARRNQLSVWNITLTHAVTRRTPERNSDRQVFSERTAQESSFMKLAIAGLLLAIGAGSAIAQTSSPSPGPTSAGPSDSSAATGMAPGAPPAERPRLQGNVPSTAPGGPISSESSGPDPSKPRTSTSPDKSDPSPK